MNVPLSESVRSRFRIRRLSAGDADLTRTRVARIVLTWVILASAQRLLVLGAYPYRANDAGRITFYDIVHGRLLWLTLANGLATDLASFIVLVAPFLLLAHLGSRLPPIGRRIARFMPILPFGVLILGLLFNQVSFHETGSPLNLLTLAAFHTPGELLDFLRRQGGLALLLAAVGAAFVIPAVLDRCLKPFIHPPSRVGSAAALCLIPLVFLFVFRSAFGAPITDLEATRQLAIIKLYEDPIWRLTTGALWAHFSPTVVRDLKKEELQRLRPLLTPGDDSPALDPAYPLYRRWKPLGSRTVEIAKPANALNVVVVFLESNSASDVGALGSTQGLTPRFDALAKDGMLFSSFYSNATDSMAGFYDTLASMYPGSRRSFHQDRGTLLDVLASHGYHGGMVWNRDTTYEVLSEIGGGLDQHPVPAGDVGWGNDREIFHQATEWATAAPRPYFLAVFTATHHPPYVVPDPGFGEPASSDELHRARHTLRFQDAMLGEFVDSLRSLPDFRDTLFVFLGDHGSRIGESGVTSLAGMREEGIHVPLLIYSPAHVPAASVSVLGSHVDVAPTILDILGVDDAEASFVGASLLRGGQGRVFACEDYGQLTMAMLGGSFKVTYNDYLGRVEVTAIGTDQPVSPTADRAPEIREMLHDILEINRDTSWLLVTRHVGPPAPPLARSLP